MTDNVNFIASDSMSFDGYCERAKSIAKMFPKAYIRGETPYFSSNWILSFDVDYKTLKKILAEQSGNIVHWSKIIYYNIDGNGYYIGNPDEIVQYELRQKPVSLCPTCGHKISI